MRVGPGCPYVHLHEEFKVFLDDHGLQHVTKPTREENMLDLIATNIPECINEFKVIPGIGDHTIPYVELSLEINRQCQAPRKIWIYKRTGCSGL